MEQDILLSLMLIITTAAAVMKLRTKNIGENADSKHKIGIKVGVLAFYSVFFALTYFVAKEATLMLRDDFKTGPNHFIWVCSLAGAIVYLPGFTKETIDKKEKKVTFVWQETVRHVSFVAMTILAFCTQELGRLYLSYLETGIFVLAFYLVIAFVTYCLKGKERALDIRDIITVFLVASVYYYLGVLLFNTTTENMLPYAPVSILVNFVPMLLLLFITANLNVTLCISTVVNMIWGLAHYFVFQFRGTVLTPGDILAVGTATTVAGQYQYSLTTEIWKLAMFSLCLIMFMSSTHKIIVQKRRVFFRIVGTSVTCIAILLWYHSDFITNMGLPYYSGFTQSKMYDNVGYTLGFIEIMKKSKVEAPDNYSKDYMETLAAEYAGEKKEDSIKPNIIVVMNETFADIGDVGPIETSQDYMPYYHSLQTGKNIAVGRTLVSTIGGGTCKTEYEFLTGNSQEYNSELAPYTTEINKEIYSIVSTLKSQGYYAIATHPEVSSNWRRNSVYKFMQFDEMHFIEAYEGDERIRGHVSDAAVYSKILSWIEEEESDAPQFVFAVTMQNHGGYEVEPLREGEELPIIRNGVETPTEVDEYLSLMYESDKALEELIANVEELEEPTVVVLFGDHFPQLGDNVWNAIESDKQRDSETNAFADSQIKYATPYLVYANYDVDMSGISDYMSINYLGANVLNSCGLNMTAYDNYLLKMQERIPAMNFCGFLTEDGTWYSFDGEVPEEYKAYIDEYNMLQYDVRYGSASEKMFALEEE